MDNQEFIKLGYRRNIIDSSNVNNALEDIIQNKKLESYPNVQRWIKNNLKNFLLEKGELKEISDINYFKEAVKTLIQNKKIQAPYHEIIIEPELIDTINHIIDYLKSEFDKEKDLSRIGYEQAKINADAWLKKRLAKLNGEEDSGFAIPLIEFEYEGKLYKWVNLRSHKALKRESFMMNNCIETYWEEKFNDVINTKEETPYYSLRDKENNSLITVNAELINKDNISKMEVLEIKEKNNQFLSHKNRIFTDILFKNREFLHKSVLYFSPYESINSKYFKVESDGNFYSLNKIVKNKMKAKNSRLKFKEINEFYSANEIIPLFHFDHVDINETNCELPVFADSINIENVNNKNINIKTNILNIKNANNIKLNLILSDKKSVIYLENVHNMEIIHDSLIKDGSLYIFKNCSDINIGGPAKIWEKNIVQINSKNIIFEKSYVSNDKTIIIDNDHTGIKLQVSKEMLKYANNSITKAYEIAISHITAVYFEFLASKETTSEDKLFLNLLKECEVEFNSKNEYCSMFDLKINKTPILLDKEQIISGLFIDPISTIKRLKDEMGLDKIIKNKNKFTVENIFTILETKKIKEFSELSEYIEKQFNVVNEAIISARPIYINLLKIDNDNDFRDYFDRFFNLIYPEKHMSSIIASSKLAAYMLKNEILKLTLENGNSNSKIAYRFAFKEKRIKSFFAKRIATYLWFKKNEDTIIASPFDNNELLGSIKNISKIKLKL